MPSSTKGTNKTGPPKSRDPIVVSWQNGEPAEIEVYYRFAKNPRTAWRIRCDIDFRLTDAQSAEWRKEHSIYRKVNPKRREYEKACNVIGWALLFRNPELYAAGCRGLLQRAVDAWRNTRVDQAVRSRTTKREAKAREKAAQLPTIGPGGMSSNGPQYSGISQQQPLPSFRPGQYMAQAGSAPTSTPPPFGPAASMPTGQPVMTSSVDSSYDPYGSRNVMWGPQTMVGSRMPQPYQPQMPLYTMPQSMAPSASSSMMQYPASNGGSANIPSYQAPSDYAFAPSAAGMLPSADYQQIPWFAHLPVRTSSSSLVPMLAAANQVQQSSERRLTQGLNPSALSADAFAGTADYADLVNADGELGSVYTPESDTTSDGWTPYSDSALQDNFRFTSGTDLMSNPVGVTGVEQSFDHPYRSRYGGMAGPTMDSSDLMTAPGDLGTLRPLADFSLQSGAMP